MTSKETGATDGGQKGDFFPVFTEVYITYQRIHSLEVYSSGVLIESQSQAASPQSSVRRFLHSPKVLSLCTPTAARTSPELLVLPTDSLDPGVSRKWKHMTCGRRKIVLHCDVNSYMPTMNL